jgi:hypothetical protein
MFPRESSGRFHSQERRAALASSPGCCVSFRCSAISNCVSLGQIVASLMTAHVPDDRKHLFNHADTTDQTQKQKRHGNISFLNHIFSLLLAAKFRTKHHNEQRPSNIHHHHMATALFVVGLSLRSNCDVEGGKGDVQFIVEPIRVPVQQESHGNRDRQHHRCQL